MTEKRTGGFSDDEKRRFSESGDLENEPTQMFERVERVGKGADIDREAPESDQRNGPKPPEYHRAEEFRQPPAAYYPQNQPRDGQGYRGYPEQQRVQQQPYEPPRASEVYEQRPEARRSENGGRIAAWLLGIAVLAATLGLALYVLVSGEDSPSSDRSSRSSSTTQTTESTTQPPSNTERPAPSVTAERSPELPSNNQQPSTPAEPNLPTLPSLPSFEAPTIPELDPNDLPDLPDIPELNAPIDNIPGR